MNIEEWAALIAIISFAGKVWRKIWKHHQKPISNVLSAIIDGIVAFLTRIRRYLDGSNDKDDHRIYGVTGGSANAKSIYIR